MPPKGHTQAGRVSKSKANATIRRITAPRHRADPVVSDPVQLPVLDPVYPPALGPVHPLVDPIPPHVDVVLLGDLVTRLEGFETGLESVKSTMLNNQLESRRAILDTFTQLMERLDRLGTNPQEIPHAVVGTEIPDILQGTLPPAVNVLGRWSWIDLSTAEAIANGSFDLNSLPKLHREEGLRNRHLAKTVQSYVIPLDGGKPGLVSGRTKMQSAFPDLSTFLSAWLIYISVRTSYNPERGPGLASWTERLVFISQRGYPWSTILDYAIAYYSDHQTSPPAEWFKVDGVLIENHIGISQQKLSVQPSNGGPSKTVQPSPLIPKHLQICLNYNRDRCKNPCPTSRRHVCAICAKEHSATHCPLAKSSA